MPSTEITNQNANNNNNKATKIYTKKNQIYEKTFIVSPITLFF